MKFPHLLDGLVGISTHAMLMHLRLYERYLERLELDPEDEEAKNSIAFHENFFSSLVRGGTDPSPAMIEKYFTSRQVFRDRLGLMEHALLQANGWAILARRPDAILQLVVVHGHTRGWIPGATPILALDGWEHAYLHDFGIAKEAYVHAIMGNIDWSKVEERLEG